MENLQKTLAGIVFLFLLVFSFNFVSATQDSNLEEFLSDDVTQITVTVTPTESWADIVLDTSEATFDEQSVNLTNKNIAGTHVHSLVFSFIISEFLNDLNGEAEIERNSDLLQFNDLDLTENGIIQLIDLQTNNLHISGTLSTKDFIQTFVELVGIQGLTVNNLNSVNNYLQQNRLSMSSPEHVVVSKQGTDYKILTDNGLGTNPSLWNSNMQTIITNSVESASIQDMINNLLPFLGEENLDLSIFNGFGVNYSVESVDLSNVLLKEGSYTVPVTIVDLNDNAQYTKDITLVLEGIDSGNSNSEGVYIPNGNVASCIKSIKEIGAKTVSVLMFDDDSILLSNILPSNILQVIRFLEITVTPNNGDGGVINFKVPTTDVSNPSLISLYVLENDGTWNKLPTTFIGTNGSFHEYTSTTPHFSTFMIAEQQPATSSGNSGRKSTTEQTQTQPVDQASTTPGAPPIEAPTEPRGFFGAITGAIIGTLGTGGSIVVILFVVSILAVLVITRANRTAGRKRN